MKPYAESAGFPAVAGWISNAIASENLMAAGRFLFWSLAFGISYTQAPLYTSNQNTKFLIGLAEGGLGFLKEDWLANMIDSMPAFTFLVYLTYTQLPEYTFYFFNILLFGVYLYSIGGIASRLYGLDREPARYLTFLAVITALHSYAFDSYSVRILGVELGQLVHYGVAEQHIIGRIFQPSVFGVFILLSLYVFLCHKIFLAAFLVVLSAIMHPAYVPVSAVVVLSYMAVVFAQEKNVYRPMMIGILSLILISPLVTYYYIQFSPSSPEIWTRASEILVKIRSPHHMDVKVWLGGLVYAKLGLIIAALFLVRRTDLFPVMLFALAIAILLTLAQWFLKNATLGAFTPWRISVFLVPLSLGVIVASAVSYLFTKFAAQVYRYQQVIAAANFAVIVMLVLYGINAQFKRYQNYYAGDSIAMMNFVRETKSSGEIYLVPVDLEDFRIYTGAPTFVTFKSGPVKDVEFVEWYTRLVAAGDFYGAEDDAACTMLKKLKADYKLTHVVVNGAQRDRRCEDLYELYKDDQYRIYRIAKGTLLDR
jgi:hypothetical protein